MRPARLATATWNTSLARSIATVVASMTSPPGYPADECQRPRAMMPENREESMPSVLSGAATEIAGVDFRREGLRRRLGRVTFRVSLHEQNPKTEPNERKRAQASENAKSLAAYDFSEKVPSL